MKKSSNTFQNMVWTHKSRIKTRGKTLENINKSDILINSLGQVESIFRRLLDSFYPKEKAKPFKPPKNGVQYGFVKFVNAESIEEVLKDAKGMTLGQRKL